MAATQTYSSNVTADQRESWFSQLVHSIRVTEMQLNTSTLSDDETHIMESLIAGNNVPLMVDIEAKTREFFVRIALKRFIGLLSESKVGYNNLAFDIKGSTVIAWLEVADTDENAKDAIVTAEAKTNALMIELLSETRLCSTIVESRDKQKIPNHFVVPQSIAA